MELNFTGILDEKFKSEKTGKSFVTFKTLSIRGGEDTIGKVQVVFPAGMPLPALDPMHPQRVKITVFPAVYRAPKGVNQVFEVQSCVVEKI